MSEARGEIVTDAPRWLRDDAEAFEIWQLLFPAMVQSNLAKGRHELSVLARYCKHTARWVKLSARVDAAGETYETESKHGKLQRINPDLKALLQIEKAMLDLEDRFGISPAARLRILSMRAAGTGTGQPGLQLDAEPVSDKSAADGAGANVHVFPGVGAVPIRRVQA